MAETLPESVRQLHDYAEVRGLVHLRNYAEALRKLKDSALNPSTKELLLKALESKEDYVIGRTFEELDNRITQALCWRCWPSK